MKKINRLKTKSDLNKIVLHPNFAKSISEIQKTNLKITSKPEISNISFSESYPDSGVLKVEDKIDRIDLNAENGYKNVKTNTVAGYDESKLKYKTLEGIASFVSHSQVITIENEYIPVTYLSFYFYTKSEKLSEEYETLRFTDEPESQSNFDYVEDRNFFLNEYTAENSILLIDGPLIGGNISAYTVELVEQLHENNIIPVFIVKNSDSNLVVDNIDQLKGSYNSDLHWSYNYLSDGQRTNYFRYTDQYNPKNAKVFYYLRFFDLSPQRIEFHRDTFEKYREVIDSIADMIYYLLILNGDKSNPQVRQVALAEKYARELLNYSNTYKLIKKSGLIPTMNQERFG